MSPRILARAAPGNSGTTPGLSSPKTITAKVETGQIAPTILQTLGLNPNALQSVVAEGTAVLPR